MDLHTCSFAIGRNDFEKHDTLLTKWFIVWFFFSSENVIIMRILEPSEKNKK